MIWVLLHTKTRYIMMGEASTGYKKKIPEIERPKIIDKKI